MTCTLSEDDIRSNFGKEKEQYRRKSAVKDDLTQKDPTSRLARVPRSNHNMSYHRQVVYCTTKLPKTGPILSPASNAKM